jgi:replicative DNA helicase
MSIISPLYNIEAEGMILGAGMAYKGAFDRVSGILQESDFYLDSHRLIWSAIESLRNANCEIDAVAVAEVISTRNQDEASGGLAYAGELARASYSAANIEHYAKIVKDKATCRALATVGVEIAEIANSAETLDEKISKANESLNALTNKKEWGTALTVSDAMKQVIEEMERRLDQEGDLSGISCGFHDIDALTYGMEDSRLIIICGRPGSGKTTLALNIAMHVALDANVLFVTREMTPKQLGYRMMASTGLVTLNELKSPKQLTKDHWGSVGESLSLAQRSAIEIDDKSYTMPQIAAHARSIYRKKGLGLIVVDYIGLLDGVGENTTQKIASITKAMKRLANELGIPVIALSQLSRDVESRSDKRPIMSDLRDSGAIEQDGDIIIGCYRDHYYTHNPRTAEFGEAVIMKNRDGETGTAYLLFDGAHSRFRNATPEAIQQYKAELGISGSGETGGGRQSRGFRGGGV